MASMTEFEKEARIVFSGLGFEGSRSLGLFSPLLYILLSQSFEKSFVTLLVIFVTSAKTYYI